jgi:hypothetical protein
LCRREEVFGSMKVGMFTAQLGVSLRVSSKEVVLSASRRSFVIERANFLSLHETAIPGVFKRGIRIAHQQPGLPGNVVFYPINGREQVRQAMAEFGWK